jgi:hypothetical protein
VAISRTNETCRGQSGRYCRVGGGNHTVCVVQSISFGPKEWYCGRVQCNPPRVLELVVDLCGSVCNSQVTSSHRSRNRFNPPVGQNNVNGIERMWLVLMTKFTFSFRERIFLSWILNLLLRATDLLLLLQQLLLYYFHLPNCVEPLDRWTQDDCTTRNDSTEPFL